MLKLLDNALLDLFKVAFDATAGSVSVSAAAELFSYLRDVVLALRPKAYSIRAGRELFEERNRFDFGDRERVIDDAIGVFFTSAGFVHRRPVHCDRGDAARFVAFEPGKHQAEQLDFRE